MTGPREEHFQAAGFAARNGLEEAIGTLEAAKQEINRYSGGF